MDSLFSVHALDTADGSSTDQADSAEAKDSAEVKPTLLWSALYIQDLIEGSMGPVVITPTPDGNLNYNDLIGSSLKMYWWFKLVTALMQMDRCASCSCPADAIVEWLDVM
ncbi:rab escort protein [Artemisia annua]|uniref:Rab escort protein n=1 Tax=Artemisia annua TaxID=35608 RepID=A0A2U1K9D8_ARTAN|nr:rab escort protein [Artemisia annua]